MKIIEILSDSLSDLWNLKNIYFKPLLIPMVTVFVVITNRLTGYSLFGKNISSVIEILSYLLITITVHRLLILGNDSVPTYGIRKPVYNDLSFILHGIGIAFFTLPIRLLVLIPVLPSTLIIPVATIIPLYIFSRFSLVFPAIAAGHNWSFSDSWQATKNHQFLMFFVTALIPGIFSIIQFVAGRVPIIEIIFLFTSPLVIMFLVSILSVSYKRIVGFNKLEEFS